MSDNPHPYDFAEAQRKANAASVRQKAEEDVARESAKAYALAEQQYRLALAEKIIELRAAGVAATTAGDLARGDKHVAELKFKRDVAEGVKDLAYQALWRQAADRKDLRRFIEWSMRAAFVGEREPAQYETPIGARR